MAAPCHTHDAVPSGERRGKVVVVVRRRSEPRQQNECRAGAAPVQDLQLHAVVDGDERRRVRRWVLPSTSCGNRRLGTTNRHMKTTARPASANVTVAAGLALRAMATGAGPMRKACPTHQISEEPSVCGIKRETATAPASGGAITRAPAANVSASVGSGAVIAAFARVRA